MPDQYIVSSNIECAEIQFVDGKMREYTPADRDTVTGDWDSMHDGHFAIVNGNRMITLEEYRSDDSVLWLVEWMEIECEQYFQRIDWIIDAKYTITQSFMLRDRKQALDLYTSMIAENTRFDSDE